MHSARREIGTKRTHFASLDDGTGTRAGVGWGGGDGGGGASGSGRVTLGDNQTEGKRGTKEWRRDFHVMCVCGFLLYFSCMFEKAQPNSTQLNSSASSLPYLTLETRWTTNTPEWLGCFRDVYRKRDCISQTEPESGGNRDLWRRARIKARQRLK